MKPIKLTMEAFGAFADKQVVDFDQFKGIFLITGPTGSGKTTIFDAMTFVLYGCIPGTREVKTVKSDYTGPDKISRVTFEFSVKEGSFKVVRTPPQQRKAKRGEGTTRDDEKVELYKKRGGEWIPETGARRAINTKIQDLIKLTALEFSKIILLPQGEFQKFLEADTQEKSRILDKLFPAKIYDDITWKAKDMATAIRRQDTSLKDRLAELTNEFKVDDYAHDLEKISKQLGIVREEKAALDKKRQNMVKTLTESRALLEDINAYAKSLKEKSLALQKKPAIQAMEEAAILAEKAAPLVTQLKQLEAGQKEHSQGVCLQKTLQEKLEETEKARQAAEDALQQVPRLQQEMKSAREELGKLSALEPKAKELQIRKKERDKQHAALEALVEADKKLKAKINKLKKAGQALAEKMEAEQNEAAKAVGLQQQLSTMEKDEVRIGEYKKIQKKIETFREKVATLEKEIKTAGNTSANLEAKSKELEELREQSLAAELATRLEAGHPCPVCGSREHPLPAKHGTAVVSKEAVDEAFKKSNQARENLARLQTTFADTLAQQKAAEEEAAPFRENPVPDQGSTRAEIKKLKKKLETCREKKEQAGAHKAELDKNRNALAKAEKASEIKSEESAAAREKFKGLETAVNLLSQDLAGHENLAGELKTLGDRCSEIEKTIDKLNAGSSNAKETFIQTKAGLDNRKRENERLEKTLKTDRDGFNQALKDKDFENAAAVRSAFLTPEKIKTNRHTVREFNEGLKVLEGAIKTLEPKAKGKVKPDMEALEKQRAECEKAYRNVEASEKETDQERTTLTDKKKEYDKLKKQLKKSAEESEHITSLANGLDGKNNRRLTFKNFVLGAYLQKVATYATQRLYQMSNQRYVMKQKFLETFDSRGQMGLDLEVFDAHSGQERSVKTLSGGEKFMASISLALGLADVIQARSGGIELDSVFIDEGFGTLSDDALQNAMQILEDIKESRLVGIISHVAELRERIPDRIIVSKGKAGSKVSVEAG